MYKVLKIRKYDFETFFELKNIESGNEIKCFEPLNLEYELKPYKFIRQGEIYSCLINIEAEVIEKREYEFDNYYEILELNIRVGCGNFAKLKLNEEIYYLNMYILENIVGIEKGKKIMLRIFYYHLLKVNDVINPVYYTTEE